MSTASIISSLIETLLAGSLELLHAPKWAPPLDPTSLPLRSLSVSPFRPLPLSLSQSVSLSGPFASQESSPSLSLRRIHPRFLPATQPPSRSDHSQSLPFGLSLSVCLSLSHSQALSRARKVPPPCPYAIFVPASFQRPSLPPAQITLSLSLSAFPSQSVSLCLNLSPFREPGKFPLPDPAPYSSPPPSSKPASLPPRSRTPSRIKHSVSILVSPFRPLPLNLSHSVSLTLQPPVQLQPPIQPPTSRAFAPASPSRVAPPSSFLASPNRRHQKGFANHLELRVVRLSECSLSWLPRLAVEDLPLLLYYGFFFFLAGQRASPPARSLAGRASIFGPFSLSGPTPPAPFSAGQKRAGPKRAGLTRFAPLVIRGNDFGGYFRTEEEFGKFIYHRLGLLMETTLVTSRGAHS
ncbi:hypothetical protein Fmac_026942 [Flemingia macrophylla]|uniref:Uncharacterized protein n=1 Tax=Flemingia macrophylla TaxID=520843 RepID=A0ABD1LGT0_9FABA